MSEPVQTLKPMLAALSGQRLARPPFWLMRQAGRYLPEYRQARARAGSFLDLCYDPDLACEVTLQPIRRFAMDGAILFSDILVVPHALGQGLDYLEGEGPKLDPIRSSSELGRLSLDGLHQRLAPVYETVRRIRASLPDEVTLIGFAGSPWTVASYMVEGGGTKDFALIKGWAYRDPAGFGALIDVVVEATITYLDHQIQAGAEVVQLFDSWAGVLPADGFRRWVIEPTRRIVAALKDRHPQTPVIGFPRGGGLYYAEYVATTGVDAVGLDTTVPTAWAATALQPKLTVQGNLDPILLQTGGDAMRAAARAILRDLAGGPFIFNLGHGITQQTPPEHVAELAAILKSWPETS